MDNLGWGLQMTVLGMGLVFGLLAALWGVLTLVLRLDRAWLAGDEGRRPGVAFILHDNDPSSWSTWPTGPSALPQAMDQAPSAWVPVRLSR